MEIKKETFQLLKQFVKDLPELQKIAKSLHKLDEMACNYRLTERQEKKQDELIERAREIAKKYGFDVYHDGDPRACTLYLITPEMKNEIGLPNYWEGIPIIW